MLYINLVEACKIWSDERHCSHRGNSRRRRSTWELFGTLELVSARRKEIAIRWLQIHARREASAPCLRCPATNEDPHWTQNVSESRKTQKSVCEPDKNDLRMNTGSPALQWQSVSCHDHGPWTAQSRTCTCQARAWLWLYFSLHLRACPPLTVYRRYCTGNTWVRRNWQLSSLIANSSFFTHLACGRWGPLSGSLCQDKHCHYRPQRVSVEMTRYLYKSCPGSQTWSHLSR